MHRRHVSPKQGLVVRDPAAGGAPLPVKGKEVTWSSYWQRRLQEGSISITSGTEKRAKKSKE